MRWNPITAANIYAEHPEMSLRDVAALFGVSHEAVRLAVMEHRPDAKERRRVITLDRNNQTSKRETAKPCVVCLSPNVRGIGNPRVRTCSPRCSRLWSAARYYLDEESRRRHRISMAKYGLNIPQKQAWALKVLSVDGASLGRRKPRYGSNAWHAWQEVLRLRRQTMERKKADGNQSG